MMRDNNLYIYTTRRNKVATIGARKVSAVSKNWIHSRLCWIPVLGYNEVND